MGPLAHTPTTGRGGSNYRKNERATAHRTPYNSSSLYDRSLKQREERQSKLQVLDQKVMEEYTFTPKTSKSFVSSRTVTTHDSSGGGGESVFSRLYRSGTCSTTAAVRSSPLANEVHGSSQYHSSFHSSGSSHRKVSSTDLTSSSSLDLHPNQHSAKEAMGRNTSSSTVSSPMMVSSRMEGAYQKHIQKMRARPRDGDEKILRDRHYEAREMEQCTFHPTTHWGRQKQGRSLTSRRSSIVMEPAPQRTRIVKPVPTKLRTNPSPSTTSQSREAPSVPREILVVNFETDQFHLEPPDVLWDSSMQSPNDRHRLQPLRLSPLLHPLSMDDGFEAIAARHHTQVDDTSTPKEDDFQIIIDRSLLEKQQRQWHRKSPPVTDYGSI